MAADPMEPPLKRLRAAIDLLEAAVERRVRQEGAQSDAQEELALMQDDRARLAVELDSALDQNRALLTANNETAKRLARAGAAIRAVLERAAADTPD
jgi:uncharacterized protein DUF4164